MTILGSDPFIGVCRISRAGFVAELTAYPANKGCLDERDPGEYWDEARSWAIDPLFLLAMFQHESSMGTAGTAARTRSWGNTRSPSFGATPVDVIDGRSGVFPAFGSWRDGLAATAGRLSSTTWPSVAPYGYRDSIRAVFDHPSNAVWAPAGDLNDPSGYLNAMLAAMRLYSDQDDEAIAMTKAAPPPIYADFLAINHTTGRGGRHPLAIILHITQSEGAAGTINWFKNPASQVSAHYIVERNGVVTALVRESDTAWINGAMAQPNIIIPVVRRWASQGINPNAETVGIECVGYSPAQPKEGRPDLTGYTEPQMDSLAFLLPAIAARHGLSLTPDTCFGHREIDSVNRRDCPGLSDTEWADIWQLDAPIEIDTANAAFDRWCEVHADGPLWRGDISGKQHWYGREPQELLRTVGGRLLAYDGAKAQDATGWSLDEWEEAAENSGQLTIFGDRLT